VSLEVKLKNSTFESIFLWISVPEEALIGLDKVDGAENECEDARAQHHVERAGARRLRLEKRRDRRDAYSAPEDHFGYAPEDVTWSHVGTLEHYTELLKRITDSAFNEGEHAA
jgi:hypothetical protein